MPNHRRQILLLFSVLVIAGMTVMATMHDQDTDTPLNGEKQKADFEDQFPIVDYTAQGTADLAKRARREAKGQKYDDAQIPISDSSGQTVSMVDWEVGLSALPTAKSAAVVIGEVTDAQAYLSSDKTGVYSEFTVRVNEILKDESQMSLTPGGSVLVEREGGRVRFPSGNILRQSTRNQGMPRIGRRYVFFLTHDFPWRGRQDQDLYILTGYELRAGRVFPLDFPLGGKHPLATTYKDGAVTSFLNDLRSAIANQSSIP